MDWNGRGLEERWIEMDVDWNGIGGWNVSKSTKIIVFPSFWRKSDFLSEKKAPAGMWATSTGFVRYRLGYTLMYSLGYILATFWPTRCALNAHSGNQDAR